MQSALRTVRSLALALWLGGIVFFGAVLAPTVFRVLPAREQAAAVVGACLPALHSLGLGCSLAMLLSIRLMGSRVRRPVLQIVLVAIMMLGTVASNRFILAPMAHDQQLAGGHITLLLPGSPLREDFDARHAWSTRVEGLVALAGLLLLVVIADEPAREGRAE